MKGFKYYWIQFRSMICKFPGWHSCTTEFFDGCSFSGHCIYCGARCLQDSNGDWFEV